MSSSRLVSPALLHSQARQAAKAVFKSVPKSRSPAGDRKVTPAAMDKTPRSRPPSLGQKLERRKLARAPADLTSGGERSRLQLKPATSPKLSVEKYPVVEAAETMGQPAGDCEMAVRPAASSQERPKPVKKEGRRSNAAVAAQPLVPWSRRSKEPPKNSGGWSWQGEGTVARVYLNVSTALNCSRDSVTRKVCTPSPNGRSQQAGTAFPRLPRNEGKMKPVLVQLKSSKMKIRFTLLGRALSDTPWLYNSTYITYI